MPEMEHTVQPGECILSIAAAEGMTWKTIWFYPANARLRQLRQHPNVLSRGDVVVIPAKRTKSVQCQTGKLHRFCVKGILSEIRIRIHDHDGPRANQPYHAEIGKAIYPGKNARTDGQGLAVCRIPAGAKEAILVVGEGEDAGRYRLLVGYMDPIDSVSGMHARLENLGLDVGGVDNPWDEQSAAAIVRFLASHPKDGAERGDVTIHDDPQHQERLREVYGI